MNTLQKTIKPSIPYYASLAATRHYSKTTYFTVVYHIDFKPQYLCNYISMMVSSWVVLGDLLDVIQDPLPLGQCYIYSFPWFSWVRGLIIILTRITIKSTERSTWPLPTIPFVYSGSLSRVEIQESSIGAMWSTPYYSPNETISVSLQGKSLMNSNQMNGNQKYVEASARPRRLNKCACP